MSDELKKEGGKERENGMEEATDLNKDTLSISRFSSGDRGDDGVYRGDTSRAAPQQPRTAPQQPRTASSGGDSSSRRRSDGSNAERKRLASIANSATACF